MSKRATLLVTRIIGGEPTTEEVEVEKGDVYCPECGQANVYCEVGDGDFYEGSIHYCLNCKQRFALMHYTKAEDIQIK